MRLTIVVAVAAILTPAALTAHPAPVPGTATAQTVASDFSATKKKKKAATPKKEEYLKAAPSAPPRTDKSTY